jgi:hypothetical protein
VLLATAGGKKAAEMVGGCPGVWVVQGARKGVGAMSIRPGARLASSHSPYNATGAFIYHIDDQKRKCRCVPFTMLTHPRSHYCGPDAPGALPIHI